MGLHGRAVSAEHVDFDSVVFLGVLGQYEGFLHLVQVVAGGAVERVRY